MTREQLYKGQEIVDKIGEIKKQKVWLDKKILKEAMNTIDADKEICEHVNTILADAQCKITNYLTEKINDFENELKEI